MQHDPNASSRSVPWHEVDRLAALHGHAILDTPDEPEFDDLVAIAAQVCEAPIAVLNFVDKARQWFKAEIGLNVRETPLDVSICAHAILEREMLVVCDTTLDRRFDCNPLVVGEPRLRFYAGVVLATPDRLPLGTICVLDTKPRPAGLTPAQAATLRALARQAMTQVEMRSLLRHGAKTRADLETALAEKELLMQEVHHRVKNSLQLVQNLLGLQARSAADPGSAAMLSESAARVHTIGLMHDHLYRHSTTLDVDVPVYMGGLVHDMRDGMASTLAGREVILECGPCTWPAADITPLGLVLTELVTNALKYGEGTIRINFTLSPGGQGVLTVGDEGNDLPDGFEQARPRGLGMRLVTGLLQPRGGGLKVVRGLGHTCLEATFPRPSA